MITMNLINKIFTVGFVVMSFSVAALTIQKQKLQKRIDIAENNSEYYRQLSNGYEDVNRVLLLTIDDFKSSKDSAMQALNQVLNDNKIKQKTITGITTVEVIIEKTDTVTIREPKNIDFEETIKFSELTKVKVGRLNDKAYAELDIKIPITIVYQENKEYRNTYKNGWSRFWHFDWKKRRFRKFDVFIENEEAEKGEVKVIEFIN